LGALLFGRFLFWATANFLLLGAFISAPVLFFMMGQAEPTKLPFREPRTVSEPPCRLNSVKMSDVDDVETFDAVESGASLVFPMQAGSVRKGGFMVIKGRPTKVREAANPEEKPRREDRLFLFSRQSGAVREVRGNPAWVRLETWQMTVLASINGRTGRARSCGARGGRECAFSVEACSISSFAFLNF
jgi:hypothetical protein